MNENLLFLIIGWLLGHLGAFITHLVQRPYRRRQIRRSISVELNELRFRLATTIYVIAAATGNLDRKMLNWLDPIITEAHNPVTITFDLDNFRKFTSLSDAEINHCNARARREYETSVGGLQLKKMAAPYLSSQLDSLSLFSPEFQRLALELLALTEVYNEHLEDVRSSFEKTFDSSLSDRSRLAVRINLRNSHQQALGLAKQLAGIAGLLLDKKN
jgi:hypothetical protein